MDKLRLDADTRKEYVWMKLQLPELEKGIMSIQSTIESYKAQIKDIEDKYKV